MNTRKSPRPNQELPAPQLGPSAESVQVAQLQAQWEWQGMVGITAALLSTPQSDEPNAGE